MSYYPTRDPKWDRIEGLILLCVIIMSIAYCQAHGGAQ